MARLCQIRRRLARTIFTETVESDIQRCETSCVQALIFNARPDSLSSTR